MKDTNAQRRGFTIEGEDNKMSLQEELVKLRRELHRNPELSLKEYKTTETLKSWLAGAGISVADTPRMPVGAVAEVVGTHPGRTVAFRADIDALPVQEQTGLSYASTVPGVMHACGHDLHMSVMAGAALLLQEHRDLLHGTVRFLFQPSEENARGAKWMAGFGVLDGVDAIFGFHNRPDLPVGTVGVKEGALMAGVNRFVITVEGKGGHAGMPQNCIDPVVAGAQLVTALQTVVSRRLSPLTSAAVSVTRFTAGNTWNVIPARAEIEGTVRALEPGGGEKIAELMKKVAAGIAEASGAKVDFAWEALLPPVLNDARFTGTVRKAAELEGLQAVPARPNLGGEDFAYFQSRVPGYFVWLGVNGTEEWHHPAYTLDEKALEPGARYFARLGRLLLSGENTL